MTPDRIDHPLRWTLLSDSEMETWWATREQSNGEFPFHFVRRLMDLRQWMAEDECPKNHYSLSVHAVAPKLLTPKEMKQCLETFGIDEEPPAYLDDLRELARLICDYGISAQVWEKSGRNKQDLLKACRDEELSYTMLFGFAMDRTVNRLGASNWDALIGRLAPWDDVPTLEERITARSVEVE